MDDVPLRQKVCRTCGTLFAMCRSCDRGHAYCAPRCPSPRAGARSHVRLFGKGRKERLCPLWP